jgi:hypothetical protein
MKVPVSMAKNVSANARYEALGIPSGGEFLVPRLIAG